MSDTEETIRAVLKQRRKQQKEEDTQKLITYAKKVIKEERSHAYPKVEK